MEHPVGVEPTNTGFADLHPTDEYWMHNVEIREIESRFEACKATVLPLNYIPISARGGSRTHKTTALNRVHIPVLLLGHNSTSGWCFSPQL